MEQDVVWSRRFEVDSLQMYFAGSLELQEELVNNGFKVPKSADGKIKTPIPIVYANFRGWIRERDPITIERLIPPEWLGETPESLGWRETRFRNRKASIIPVEEVYVNVVVTSDNKLIFKLDAKGYHLERTSIRGVNPEKWNNWIMFYISMDSGKKLLKVLEELYLGKAASSTAICVAREDQQGGREITYYAYLDGREGVGIPVKDYSFCLGCFPLALKYLKVKAVETGLDPNVVNNLRLKIRYDPSINAGLKVGVAKIIGKNPQVMFKIASNTQKSIKGILKDIVIGKARGVLEKCSHRGEPQYIVVEASLLYVALKTAMPYLEKLPSDEEHEAMLRARRG